MNAYKKSTRQRKRRKRESKLGIAVGLFDLKVFILTTCVPIPLKEVKRVIRNSKIPNCSLASVAWVW